MKEVGDVGNSDILPSLDLFFVFVLIGLSVMFLSDVIQLQHFFILLQQAPFFFKRSEVGDPVQVPVPVIPVL